MGDGILIWDDCDRAVSGSRAGLVVVLVVLVAVLRDGG